MRKVEVLHLVLWCLAIGICQLCFADDDEEDLENTPIVGYTTTDCSFDSETDKKQDFESVRALYLDSYLNNNKWWSYHPKDNAGGCRSLMETMTVVGERRSRDISTSGFVNGIGFLLLWNTSSLRNSINPRVSNEDVEPIRKVRDADSCWRKQASSLGDTVEYNSTRYALEIDNTISGYGRFDHGTIKINHSAIKGSSPIFDEYTLRVFTLIHESWHGDEPSGLRSKYHRERWVQQKSYETWDALYEEDPPFGYRTLEELNFLYNEWKEIDEIAEEERSIEEQVRYQELHEEMKQSPLNDEYDKYDDVIPKCD